MIHIVTPLSRPENIAKLAASVRETAKRYKNVFWHIVIDRVIPANEQNYLATQLMFDDYVKLYDSPHHKSLAGHSHRNFFLDTLRDDVPLSLRSENDWIYFLDDDTILHPDFIATITDTLYKFESEKMPIGMIVFDQDLNESTPRLKADRSKIEVGFIDTGMFLFHFNKTPDLRFDATDYCADGHFAVALRDKLTQEGIYIINKTLSYYNYLRP